MDQSTPPSGLDGLDWLPVPCCRVNGGLSILQSNSAFRAMFGPPPGPAAPSLLDYVHSLDQASVAQAVRHVLADGEPAYFDCCRRDDDDATEGPLEIAAARSPDGASVLAVIREALVSADDRERLQHDVQRLEQQNDDLRQFAFAVAHDLKAPLLTTESNLSLLEQDVAAGRLDRIAEDLSELRGAVYRMQDLVTELLELARLGRLDLATVGGRREQQPVPLGPVVAEALRLLKGPHSELRAEIACVAPLPVVRGRRHHLVEVFQNLIDNAVKYSSDADAPRVEIGCEPRTAGTVLFVRDNGRGVPPGDRERVFELFVQLDPQNGGTGIGLGIVRRIVAAHGGRIWIEDGLDGRGAAFCFTLPLEETS